MTTDIGAVRRAFWGQLAAAAPDLGIQPATGQERELRLAGHPDLRLKLSLSQGKTSVYLVAAAPAGRTFVTAHLRDLARELRTVVGAATGEADKGRWFRKDTKIDVTQPSQWPAVIAWLLDQRARYEAAVLAVAEGALKQGR